MSQDPLRILLCCLAHIANSPSLENATKNRSEIR
jgi:hypothetical protein